MAEREVQPNKLYKITYSHAMSSDQTNYVRATSITKAIEKWTEKGAGWHEEETITAIEILCDNLDDFAVVYWD